MKNLARRLFPLLLVPALGGCSLFSGLTQTFGSVLGFAISLALVAAPFVLAYYLYHRHIL